MNVAYGPPGQSGVQTLMHVGAEDGDGARTAQIYQISGTVGIVSVGVWAWGHLSSDETLRRAGFAVSLASFLVRLASRPK